MKLLRYNITPNFVNIVRIPTMHVANWRLFTRRLDDDDLIKVGTCCLSLNKRCVWCIKFCLCIWYKISVCIDQGLRGPNTCYNKILIFMCKVVHGFRTLLDGIISLILVKRKRYYHRGFCSQILSCFGCVLILVSALQQNARSGIVRYVALSR